MFCGSGGSTSRLAQSFRCQIFFGENHGWVRSHLVRRIRGHNARRCGAKHMSTWTCPKHPNVGASFEVAMWEKCTRLWRKARVQVKCFKHLNLVLLEGCFFQKCTQVWGKAKWCEAHSEVNMSKAPHVGSSFGRSRVVFHGRRNGFCTLSNVSKMWRFCSSCKNDGEGLPRCISPGRRSTRDRHVKRSGCWFPERGCILENLFRFAKIILRDRCSPSYDLASLFRGRCSTLERWRGKIAKHNGMRPSALHSTFHFWGKSRRFASFLTLSISKIEEALLPLLSSQVKKIRRSRRIPSFWACHLPSFQADRQTDRYRDRQLERKTDRQIDRESDSQVDR